MDCLEPCTGTARSSSHIPALIMSTSCHMVLPKEVMPQHCCLQTTLLKAPKSELDQGLIPKTSWAMETASPKLPGAPLLLALVMDTTAIPGRDTCAGFYVSRSLVVSQYP